MDPTTTKNLLYIALAIGAVLSYLVVSFGPYLAGKHDERRKTVKELIRFSLDDPEGFELWLREEQLKTTEADKQQLEETLGIAEAQQKHQAKLLAKLRRHTSPA